MGSVAGTEIAYWSPRPPQARRSAIAPPDPGQHLRERSEPMRRRLFLAVLWSLIATPVHAGVANLLVNSKMADGFGSAQVEPSVATMGPGTLVAYNTDKFSSAGYGITASFNPTAGFGPWLDAPLPPVGSPMAKWVADPVVSANPKVMAFYLSGIFAPTGAPG